jgi:hypothetical protein
VAGEAGAGTSASVFQTKTRAGPGITPGIGFAVLAGAGGANRAVPRIRGLGTGTIPVPAPPQAVPASTPSAPEITPVMVSQGCS